MLFTGCAAAPEQAYVPAASTAPIESIAAEPVNRAEEPAQGDEPATSNAAVVSAGQEPDAEPVPDEPKASYEYHRPTEKECRLGKMEMFLKYCSTQVTVETNKNACVVDVRTADNPYDVVWDYGQKYNSIVSIFDWSMVFDADYYMEQFPMLVYQYHYDEDLLLQHFQTVGVHEGRQDNARFNVADYMSKCDADVRQFYGDCYAAYYFHWMNIETNYSVNVSGKDQPKQMIAVMTAMQAYEFEQVNELRESLGLEPLVFDSELAAMGNFRSWVDADEDWQMHEWLHANRQAAYDMIASFGSTSAGENTVKSYGPYSKNWYDCYYNSDPHYAAMVDSKYVYLGCSNAYLGDCAHKPSGIVMVEFDMFSHDIKTALDP